MTPPTATPISRRPIRCDIFCQVIDNLGDAGVCWRLAQQLVQEQGWQVRLWIDAPQVLARLVPQTRAGRMHQGVRVERWPAGVVPDVAEVVIAAFACALPAGYRARMRPGRAVWINLDYLSAQPWVDSHHGLPSPKPDGLVEHFFFPGFTAASGGLIREAGLLDERSAFEADPWARQTFLDRVGVQVRPGDRFASLFCYPDSPVEPVLHTLAHDTSAGRWRVLLPAGVSIDRSGLSDVAAAVLEPIPFVPQRDYDPLLWCCELNFVRGEDSWVRALWSGRPLIWQAYRQDEQAHHDKLHAFIDHWQSVAQPMPAAGRAWRTVHEAWNGVSPPETLLTSVPALLQGLADLRAAARRWESVQRLAPDLASRLVEFVSERL